MSEEKIEEEWSVDDGTRGSPLDIWVLEAFSGGAHAIIGSKGTRRFHVCISSFLNKNLLALGDAVLLKHDLHRAIGILDINGNWLANAMKLVEGSTEPYVDTRGVESWIQENVVEP